MQAPVNGSHDSPSEQWSQAAVVGSRAVQHINWQLLSLSFRWETKGEKIQVDNWEGAGKTIFEKEKSSPKRTQLHPSHWCGGRQSLLFWQWHT